MELFHCFGARPDHRVDASQAAAMLEASGCGYLAVNTHTIEHVSHGDDLPVGYDTATFGTVRALIGPDSPVRPVLNSNLPTTAEEAVACALFPQCSPPRRPSATPPAATTPAATGHW